MGFNDFHKGFVKREDNIKTTVISNNKFGVRSIDEIIKARYNRNEVREEEKKIERKSTDYQQNMRGQLNLRNLDK